MLTRIQPVLPVEAMQTYSVIADPASVKAATCKDVDCPRYTQGWETKLSDVSEQGRMGIDYIRHGSGRYFVETREGSVVTFTFAPGQECFTKHRKRDDRMPGLFVWKGDWRQNLGLIRKHTRVEDFIDDSKTHLGRVADQ